MENRFYCELQASGYCAFYVTTIPETAVEISEETHQRLITGLNHENKLVYTDKTIIPDGSGNQFLLRDRNTKWDEASQSWIPDEDAINIEAAQQLQIQAQNAFNKANLGRFEFDQLSRGQRKYLNNYLSQLQAIISGKSNAMSLPDKPCFLNVEGA